MKTILNSDKLTAQLCGRQKDVGGKNYRLSRYCIKLACEDGLLLYQTMTGKMLLFEDSEAELENRGELIAEWFLVPEDYNEKKHVDDLRRIAQLLQPSRKTVTNFTVVTTTDCNARCYYCYEHGIPKITMNEQTAHDAAAYISDSCGGEEVSLMWFGGEPLYNSAAIDIICADLRDHGISFHSTMVSNGFYLDRQTAQKGREKWNLKRVQIAIDGTETVYNRTKAYVDCAENAYERVLNNIENALDAGIAVTARLNMSRNNADNMLEVCKVLASRFSQRAGFQTQIITLKDLSDRVRSFDNKDQSNQYFYQLSKLAEEQKIGSRDRLIRGIVVNRCKADNPRCETIYPDGTVGRCENYDPCEVTGTIYESNRDPEITQSWKEREYVQACDGCLHYPYCITLKKCIWDKGECTEYARERRTFVLRQQILNAYHLAKQGDNADIRKGFDLVEVD